MDYSKYTFNQLTEALAAMDKQAYPDNYKALSAAIQAFPSERLQKEVFTEQVTPMGINQLKIRLVETSKPEERKILETLIQEKSNRLNRAKIWMKWIAIIMVTAISSAFVPRDFKAISGIVALIVLVGSIFMAVRQHRAFNRKVSTESPASDKKSDK